MEPVRLAVLPTPLERMDRLAEWLGGGFTLLVKRDDLTGLALGGNKARKLEWLCGEALEAGADTLVTGGGHQSNHVRMTAGAAARLGLSCHLVMAGDQPEHHDGNLLLDRLLGASMEYCGRDGYYEVEEAIEAAAERLAGEGRRPFAIPIGGASTTGALAYAKAADELLAEVVPDRVVVADGSGGTHAGLLAGLGERVEVVGVDVGARPDLDEIVPKKAADVAAVLGLPAPPGEAVVDHDHVGPGYARLSPECVEAVRTTARLEGIVLDPVYSGKGMAALFTWAREGRIQPGETVVFWHTGGSPALFSRRYEERLVEEAGEA